MLRGFFCPEKLLDFFVPRGFVICPGRVIAAENIIHVTFPCIYYFIQEQGECVDRKKMSIN